MCKVLQHSTYVVELSVLSFPIIVSRYSVPLYKGDSVFRLGDISAITTARTIHVLTLRDGVSGFDVAFYTDADLPSTNVQHYRYLVHVPYNIQRLSREQRSKTTVPIFFTPRPFL